MNVELLFSMYLFGRKMSQSVSSTHRELMVTGVILWLTRKAERSITELSELLAATPSTVSEKLTQLEHDQLIQRVASAADKRTQMIVITQRGNDQLDDMINLMNHNCRLHTESLTKEEVVIFETLLQKILKES